MDHLPWLSIFLIALAVVWWTITWPKVLRAHRKRWRLRKVAEANAKFGRQFTEKDIFGDEL